MAIARHRFLIRFLFVVTLVMVVLSGAAEAQTKKRKRVRDTGQDAIVTVDGAAIYEFPNFDSPVMDYLDRGRKVRISKKLYKGIGGLGAFYKIRVRKGVYGYITDVDVRIAGKGSVAPKDDNADEGLDDPTELKPDLERPDDDTPGTFLFTRYMGLNFNIINYAEEIAKRKEAGTVNMIGLKMSGPGKIMGGMPLDMEFTFTSAAPDFYDKYMLSSSGFLLMGHIMTMFPLIEKAKWYAYYGFGLMGKYSKFDVKLKAFPNNPPIDSQDLAVGVGGHLGAAVALGRNWCLRVDGKYYYEKEAYFGYGGALQMKF